MAAEPTRPTDDENHRILAIHGLGATSGVWAGLTRVLGEDRSVIAPDLPGHGTSAWTGHYTIDSLATAVSTACDEGEPVVAVGHSLGGAVALALASGRFGPAVRAVVAIGVKVVWTDDDVAGMAKVADRGVRWFATRDEAVDRYLRQAGLAGIVGPDDPAMAGAVVDEDGRWRVAQDPATFAQRPPDMAGLMAAARCPVILAAGEHDAMSTSADLARFTDAQRIGAGLGHNAHVEDPAWVAELIAAATH
jgi:pimeloyl-ACP methyl ester carboxylesterase